MHNPYAAPRAELELPFAPAYAPRLIAWDGRIGRARFLAYSLSGLAFALFYVMIVAILDRLIGLSHSINSWGSQVHTAIFLLIPVPAIVNATRRRLHDFEVSGWWTLFLLLPIFQFVFVIYLLVAPGTSGANRFGPAPPPTAPGMVLGAIMGSLLLSGFTALRFL